MNDPTKNQLKDLLMKELVDYIYTVWGAGHKINAVEIVEETTFSDSFPKAFYVKKEYGTTLEESLVPHTYGIIWGMEDLEVTIGDSLEDAGKMSLFSRTYSNNTDKAISVSEKLEEAIQVTNSTTISFTEKINAGTETSVSAGVNIAGVTSSVTAKFSMNVELGASQSSTKTVEQTTTAGFQMQFDVSPHTKKVVTITAERKISRAFNDATFVANGKIFAKVAYGDEKLTDATHIYVIETEDIKKFTKPVSLEEGSSESIEKKEYPLEYPVKYVVEGVEHTNYNVEIKEIALKDGVETNVSEPIRFPLDVQTTTLFSADGK